MAEEQDKILEQMPRYGEQDAWGNSIASLRRNLKLTPLERLRKAERAAKFVSRYKGAARKNT